MQTVLRIDLPLAYPNDKFRERLIRHLTRLSPEDRYMRFFTSFSDHAIEAYVDRVLRSNDGLFLVYDETGEEVIGMVHMGLLHAGVEGGSDGKPEYEMGISVNEEHRGKGIGYVLFETMCNWIKARGAKRVFMSCLNTNIPMQKIVKKYNMTVKQEDGEQQAELVLPGRADIIGVMIGNLTNSYALYDLMYRRQLRALWATPWV